MPDITYCLSCKRDTRNIDPNVIIEKLKIIEKLCYQDVLFAIIKSQHLRQSLVL